MSLHRVMKRRADKIYTGLNFTKDGTAEPRVKKKDKKQRQKRMRRHMKQDTANEIKCCGRHSL